MKKDDLIQYCLKTLVDNIQYDMICDTVHMPYMSSQFNEIVFTDNEGIRHQINITIK